LGKQKVKITEAKAEIAQAKAEKLKSALKAESRKQDCGTTGPRSADQGADGTWKWGALPNLSGAAHQRRQRQRSALPIPVNAILALLDRGEQSELR